MGLQAVYEQFLKRPNAAILADDAILQYVTTLKPYTRNTKIVEHLGEQEQNVVKKRTEKVISGVEGLTAVALIVETTLQFISSGGAYLPGLDSFILDKTATLPITHFVHFDQNNKISQIRLSWDQGDLLKQVEVIGRTGRNWPIFTGKEQIRTITASTNTANEVNPAPALSPRGRQGADGTERSMSPSKKYIRDPHASLDLSKAPEEERVFAANPVAPRESHKPAPREMSDLFAAGHEDYQPGGQGNSPRKVGRDNVVAPKGAGQQKFQQSRIFAEDEPVKEAKIYKTNPARYNHFDIGDADQNDSFQHHDPNARNATARGDMPGRAQNPKKNHHASQWDFEDFVTPEKVKQKTRDQDVVHFSVGDENSQPESQHQQQIKPRKDAEAHFEFQDNGTPVHRPAVPKARKDANAHFDFTDEPTPAPRRIIARTKAAEKLYADPVFDNEEEKPLATISHNARARKNNDSHWDAADESPADSKPVRGTGKQQGRPGSRRENDKSSFWDF